MRGRPRTKTSAFPALAACPAHWSARGASIGVVRRVRREAIPTRTANEAPNQANTLELDNARRIALNVAKLPEVGRPGQDQRARGDAVARLARSSGLLKTASNSDGVNCRRSSARRSRIARRATTTPGSPQLITRSDPPKSRTRRRIVPSHVDVQERSPCRADEPAVHEQASHCLRAPHRCVYR